MLKKRFLLGSLVAATVLFTASSCMVYHPHNVDIPLLEEQGDLHVDVSASMTAPLMAGPALNASVAYAPIQMLGVQAAASVTDLKNNHFQLAAGTYQVLGRPVLECYIGYARGNAFDGATSSESSRHYDVSGYYNLFFSQINFGYNSVLESDFDWGLGLKGGLMNPRWDKIEHLDDGSTALAERHEDSHFLIEPQLMMRFGGEHFKISLNFAYAFLSDWPVDNNYFNYDRFSAGVGLHYKF